MGSFANDRNRTLNVFSPNGALNFGVSSLAKRKISTFQQAIRKSTSDHEPKNIKLNPYRQANTDVQNDEFERSNCSKVPRGFCKTNYHVE